MLPIKSNLVTDKIPAIFICGFTDQPSSKIGSDTTQNREYIATSRLNEELKTLLDKNVKYKVTCKIDGTCGYIGSGQLFKRRDLKLGRNKPKDWFDIGNNANETNTINHGAVSHNAVGHNAVGHNVGFMPLEKCDIWHIDCFIDKERTNINILAHGNSNNLVYKTININELNNKTVEIVGPKFNGNPHKLEKHAVVEHGLFEIGSFPKLTDTDLYNGIKEWFQTSSIGKLIEGVVIHFESGDMFKLHRHHLRLPWDNQYFRQIESLDQIKMG